MATAQDFRVIQLQASDFTPQLQIRATKVFGHLLSKYADQFDGNPTTLPNVQNIPREMPQLLLTSADNRLRLQVAPARLDVVREENPITDDGIADFQRLATDLILDYLSVTQGKVGRVASIMGRIAPDPNPGRTLAEHFCQEKWLRGPLNRPGDFELHAHKRFHLDALFEVNSWIRCKAAKLEKAGTEGPVSVILLEQDFNSLAEELDTREINENEIRQFFAISPRALQEVVSLYFPA